MSHPFRYRPAYGRADTAIYLSSIVGACAVLALAWSLEPSSRGLGTHEQLGLPPCWFLTFTGYPCPSCGLTTSFAFAARFRFLEALMVQPFGVMQFVLTAAAVPVFSFLMWRRVPLDELVSGTPVVRLVAAWLTLYLSGWIYKLAAM